MQARHCSSVGCASACYVDGHGFDSHVRQHSFVEIGHEIISADILSLPLIQEGQLSVTGRGARWLSGRVSDSGARGPGFETYRRRVVSLSKTLYSPKVLVNYPGSGGSVPT